MKITLKELKSLVHTEAKKVLLERKLKEAAFGEPESPKMFAKALNDYLNSQFQGKKIQIEVYKDGKPKLAFGRENDSIEEMLYGKIKQFLTQYVRENRIELETDINDFVNPKNGHIWLEHDVDNMESFKYNGKIVFESANKQDTDTFISYSFIADGMYAEDFKFNLIGTAENFPEGFFHLRNSTTAPMPAPMPKQDSLLQRGLKAVGLREVRQIVREEVARQLRSKR